MIVRSLLATFLLAACASHPAPAADMPAPAPPRGDPAPARIAAGPGPGPAPVEPATPAPPPPTLPRWSRRFGGPGLAMGAAVAVDRADHIALAGHFTGTVEIVPGQALVSAGLEDVFVARLDPYGRPLWTRRFGGPSHDYADTVAVDGAGNVLLTGAFLERIDIGGRVLPCKGVHDVFLAKLSPDGDVLWSRAYGDREDQIKLFVAADGSGSVLLAGYFRGAVRPARRMHRSYPDKASFVAVLDPDGKPRWSDSFGHIYDYAGPGVVADGDGNVFFAGGSDPVPELGGKTPPRGRTEDLGVVAARYDATGRMAWRKRFGGGSSYLNVSIALDPQGDPVVAGSFGGRLDFGGGELSRSGSLSDVFLAALDREGGHRWSRSFGGTGWQGLSGLVVRGDGAILATGQFEGGAIDLGGGPLPSAGSSDVWLAAWDGSGRHRWSRSFGDTHVQFPGGLALDSAGDIVLVGSFSSTIDFGDGPLVSAGAHDVFLVKLPGDGFAP